MLALTATAAPPVRDEIVERLHLRDPELIIRGFDRPNIRLSVERFHGEGSEERKLRALADRIAASAPPGIVYVATRRQAEELASELCTRGALPNKTVQQVYGEMIKAKRAEGLSERYIQDLESRVGKFSKECGKMIAAATTMITMSIASH